MKVYLPSTPEWLSQMNFRNRLLFPPIKVMKPRERSFICHPAEAMRGNPTERERGRQILNFSYRARTKLKMPYNIRPVAKAAKR
jgi:hypothetical protein